MRRRMPMLWRRSVVVVVSAFLFSTTLQSAGPMRPKHPIGYGSAVNGSASDPGYQFVPVELPGGEGILLWEINNRGVAVGTFFDHAGRGKTFTWYKGQVTSVIAHPDSDFTSVVGIDEVGRLFGNWGTMAVQDAGLYDPRTDSWTQFPAIPGKPLNLGVKLGPNGLAVGMACEGDFYNLSGCEMWVSDGTSYSFFTIPGAGGLGVNPFNMNDRGQVIGAWQNPLEGPSGYHTFLWENGAFFSVDLPEVPRSVGYDISSSGQMLMLAPLDPGGYWVPLLLNRGKAARLPLFPGSIQTLYSGMNERGDLVGEYYDENWASHPIVAIRK